MGDSELQIGTKAGSHPCFSIKASGTVGRMHLPVAPRCNIQCNFCNRKFDCATESRPGVTSEVLTPKRALARLEFVLARRPEIAVVGIAGPGDPLANPEETLKTFRLVRAAHPELALCLSTNGLVLEEYLQKLLEAGLSHITITINSFNPEVSAEIYDWVEYNGHRYSGLKASRLLIERQKAALRALEGRSIPCKINIVLIPGVNDRDIPDLVDELKNYSAVTCVNIMPFIPVEGSKFKEKSPPSKALLNSLRNELEPKIPQIRHCCQCRSDAVGFVTCGSTGRSLELLEALNDSAEGRTTKMPGELQPGTRVAVASSDAHTVSEHFGHASQFIIYRYEREELLREELRDIEPLCCSESNVDGEEGAEKLSAIIRALSDCKIIVCTKIGPGPRDALESAGFLVMEEEGPIKSIFTGKKS